MSRRRRVVRALAALAGGVLVALAVAEVVVRTNRERFGLSTSDLWELRAFVCGGESGFRPTAYYGWVFSPDLPSVNHSGFLGTDVERARHPGVLRIACLGGSTTAGNRYAGPQGSYPGALESILAERLGRPFEVLNFGVPGWTTAESLVQWILDGQDYRPDLVFIHHASNDLFPRLAPGFRSDYTHFFHPWRTRPTSALHRFLTRWSDLYALQELRGGGFDLFTHVAIPEREFAPEVLPGTDGAYRRNLETLIDNVRRIGAVPVLMTMAWEPNRAVTRFGELCIVGLVDRNQVTRDVAAGTACELFDLARSEDSELGASYIDLVHLTPEGNHRKAELVADFLLERGLVPR